MEYTDEAFIRAMNKHKAEQQGTFILVYSFEKRFLSLKDRCYFKKK